MCRTDAIFCAGNQIRIDQGMPFILRFDIRFPMSKVFWRTDIYSPCQTYIYDPTIMYVFTDSGPFVVEQLCIPLRFWKQATKRQASYFLSIRHASQWTICHISNFLRSFAQTVSVGGFFICSGRKIVIYVISKVGDPLGATGNTGARCLLPARSEYRIECSGIYGVCVAAAEHLHNPTIVAIKYIYWSQLRPTASHLPYPFIDSKAHVTCGSTLSFQTINVRSL